jgi:hypothetical protein
MRLSTQSPRGNIHLFIFFRYTLKKGGNELYKNSIHTVENKHGSVYYKQMETTHYVSPIYKYHEEAPNKPCSFNIFTFNLRKVK